VVGQNDVCALRDADVGVEPPLAEAVELLEQRPGVDDTAVPEDADRVPDGAAGNERELVLLSFVDDGVARVVAALVPGDDVGRLAKEVDDAALALVSELGTDDCHGHQAVFPPSRVNRFRSHSSRVS